MPTESYKTVKITQSTYDTVQALKRAMLMSGVKKLPVIAREKLEDGLTVSSVISAACALLADKVGK